MFGVRHRASLRPENFKWMVHLWIGLFLLIRPGPAMGEDPAVAGRWSQLQSWPIVAMHAHLLPNGKVQIWDFDTGHFLWDLVKGGFQPVPNPGYHMMCGGHTSSADGRLFSAGGHEDPGDEIGVRFASIYDYTNNSWTRLPDMADRRYYPTATALSSGDVLVLSGAVDPITGVNLLPEVWEQSTQRWRPLTGALRSLPLYPWIFAAPNGHAFYAGPSTETAYLDTSGSGGWSPSFLHLQGDRHAGTAVMYEPGKVLVMGGGTPPTTSAEVIDLNSAVPSWRTTQPMNYARQLLDATLLPDGTVFVVGGNSGATFNNPAAGVLTPEVWNPTGESWTPLAPHSVYRGYHSISLLLPDGRVLVAGGGELENTAEIFSPPYLFQGRRPRILYVRKAVNFGETYTVRTRDAERIAKVSWLRLGSVTHGLNQSQVINFLEFSKTEAGLLVTAPANGNLSPPGYYMLFLIDRNGTPSVASVIRIGAPARRWQGIARPLELVAWESLRRGVYLTWTDNSNSEEGFIVERSADGGKTFFEIGVAETNVTSYMDLEVVRGTTHSYRVKAYAIGAESAYSNTVSVTAAKPSFRIECADCTMETSSSMKIHRSNPKHR